jgi:UDP-N-acetylmuramate--alanine ligase
MEKVTILVDFDHTLFDTEKYAEARSVRKINDYKEFLYPDAVDFIKYASSFGEMVLFSEGDVPFQKEKIKGTGIENLFSGGVKIFPSYSKMKNLDNLKTGDKVVLIDDKPEVTDYGISKGFTVIRVRRGKYSSEEAINEPNFVVKSLSEIIDKDILRGFMNPAKKIHFLGIGGSGMSGVAMLSDKMGYEVSGCDLEDSTAYAEGIFKGHNPDHIKNADLLVVSPAVYYQNKNNPELVLGEKRKIAITWQEFLGSFLLKDKKMICIAGTHGKSTTTAMAGQLLIDAGLDPIVVVGANVPEWGGNSRFGKGIYAVVEADEFNNNFLNYHPDIAVINNIEFDHPDFFKDGEEVKESFQKFTQNLKGKKILITEKDSLDKHFNLKILGEHNQKNANMVYILGKKLGIGDDVIIKSLESFNGIGRRMELIADQDGIKVYDDYAHHPTAIAATLQGIKGKYPNARIIAIDEPHGFARTNALLSNYKNSFADADLVLIGPIFKARDSQTYGLNPQLVAGKTAHPNARGYDSFDEIKEVLRKDIKKGDVILVMGAGKSYLWAREIVELIK